MFVCVVRGYVFVFGVYFGASQVFGKDVMSIEGEIVLSIKLCGVLYVLMIL